MKLGLVIDLDVCVGCHACTVSCKQWNTSGSTGPLTDLKPYDEDPQGVWFNRIRHFEVGDAPNSKTVNMPMSCMHCEQADCVDVCPTGASYKRIEDGIVLIDQDKCMGCNYCSWACPYGARELDRDTGTMKKCTLCIDRIYDESLQEEDRQPSCVTTCPSNARHYGDFDDPNSNVSKLVRERGGHQLMPELGYSPTNHYLPPRITKAIPVAKPKPESLMSSVKKWVNQSVTR